MYTVVVAERQILTERPGQALVAMILDQPTLEARLLLACSPRLPWLIVTGAIEIHLRGRRLPPVAALLACLCDLVRHDEVGDGARALRAQANES